MPQKNLSPLLPEHSYHIYNRGINGMPIFFQADNYAYFLKLYRRHVSPVVETFAYCLLRNHFHFLVRIKPLSAFPAVYQDGRRSLSIPFGHWFNAYTQGVNREQSRTGSLFEKPFRRVPITSEEQLIQNVFYIHANPQKHGVWVDFRRYPHSSYRAYLSQAPTQLHREQVWSWFGGPERFAAYHDEWHSYLSTMMELMEG